MGRKETTSTNASSVVVTWGKYPVEIMVDQCDRVVAVIRQVLGEAVVGVYLHGSATSRGLKPTSDIDILVYQEMS